MRTAQTHVTGTTVENNDVAEAFDGIICSACGTELPEGASFCLHCGAALRGIEGTPAVLESCEIAFWRGYLSACFFAMPAVGPAPLEAPARSAYFMRLRATPPSEEEGSALKAFESLLERLEGEGWEIVGEGPLWYQRRLLRRLGAPARRAAREAHA